MMPIAPDDELLRAFSRREEVLDTLRRILIEKLRVRREPAEIDPDTPLFGSGLRLDSIDAVELWISVRMAFGLKVPEDDRRLTALRTLNTLASLVLEAERSAPDVA